MFDNAFYKSLLVAVELLFNNPVTFLKDYKVKVQLCL